LREAAKPGGRPRRRRTSGADTTGAVAEEVGRRLGAGTAPDIARVGGDDRRGARRAGGGSGTGWAVLSKRRDAGVCCTVHVQDSQRRTFVRSAMRIPDLGVRHGVGRPPRSRTGSLTEAS